MANVIKIKYSDTPAAVPSSLAAGEIAINRADKILYYTNDSNVIQSMSLVAGTSTNNPLMVQIFS